MEPLLGRLGYERRRRDTLPQTYRHVLTGGSLSHCPTRRQLISPAHAPARVGSWPPRIVHVFNEIVMKRVLAALNEPRTIHEYVTYRTVTKAGVSDWSDVVSLSVV
jgi:hypothetical protein